MAPAAACVLAFTFAPKRDAAGSDAVAQEPWSGAPISAARLKDFKGKHGETLISRMRECAAKEHSGEGPIELRFERFAWGLGGAKFLQDFVKEGSRVVPEKLEGREALEVLDYVGVEVSADTLMNDDYLDFGNTADAKMRRKRLRMVVAAREFARKASGTIIDKFSESVDDALQVVPSTKSDDNWCLKRYWSGSVKPLLLETIVGDKMIGEMLVARKAPDGQYVASPNGEAIMGGVTQHLAEAGYKCEWRTKLVTFRTYTVNEGFEEGEVTREKTEERFVADVTMMVP